MIEDNIVILHVLREITSIKFKTQNRPAKFYMLAHTGYLLHVTKYKLNSLNNTYVLLLYAGKCLTHETFVFHISPWIRPKQ